MVSMNLVRNIGKGQDFEHHWEMKILKTIWESNYPEVVLQETFHGNLDMLRTAYGLFDPESICLLELSVILVEGLNTIHVKLSERFSTVC